ncbi:MAG: thioredoxin family protein [Bacteroidota bacterium]
MKQFLLLLLGLLLVINLEAQDAGIAFSNTDWEKTLELAKEQKKLIFVDAYTTWCGPCKWMAANVFPQEEVGKLFNESFINVKIDMEKGEGILFAKAYDVYAYPTYLVINTRGDMVHQGLGRLTTEEFIDFGEAATDPDRQVGTLMSMYEEGERDPEFLRKFALALSEIRNKDASEVASQYMATQKDWKTEENMDFVLNTAPGDMDSELYKFVKSNREAYYQSGNKSQANYLLSSGIRRQLYKEKDFDKQRVAAIYKEVFGADGAKMGDDFWLQHLSRKAKEPQHVDAYLTAAVEFMDTYKIKDWQQLNSIAWRFYELTDDQKMLLKAKSWSEQSVKIKPSYYNHDTLASICFKLQEKELAAKHARLAIEFATADGMEAKETKELLDKINAL